MARILLVEDEKPMRLLTSAKLRGRFDVLCACDGEEALELLEHHTVDAIVADVMMPRMDGYTLSRTLRECGYTTPILLLTAKQEHDDKREGFSSGIDDYMTKPVNYEELVWRLHALLRRSKIADSKKIAVGESMLDAGSYTIATAGQRMELPKKEFELLFKLLSYPGQIFTKGQLLDDIWGFDSESGEDTVKVHVSRLRNRLKGVGDFRIVTVKGLGYKAEIATEEAQ